MFLGQTPRHEIHQHRRRTDTSDLSSGVSTRRRLKSRDTRRQICDRNLNYFWDIGFHFTPRSPCSSLPPLLFDIPCFLPASSLPLSSLNYVRSHVTPLIHPSCLYSSPIFPLIFLYTPLPSFPPTTLSIPLQTLSFHYPSAFFSPTSPLLSFSFIECESKTQETLEHLLRDILMEDHTQSIRLHEINYQPNSLFAVIDAYVRTRRANIG